MFLLSPEADMAPVCLPGQLQRRQIRTPELEENDPQYQKAVAILLAESGTGSQT